MAWALFLLSPGRVLRSALHFLYMIGGGIPEGDFGRPKGAGLVPPIPKNQKSPFPQFPNSKPKKIKKSLQKFKIFKISKVYTPHASNSTKINPVNQIITAYTFLGITLCNLPIVFVPINVYNKVNLKSKSGGNKHGNQTYG